MLGIGVDFGTSNSSVAVFDGERLVLLRLDPLAPTPSVMPSALYLDRALRAQVGQAGIERYLADNAGRRIELRREDVGQIEVTVASTDTTGGTRDGAITDVFSVHAFTDQDLPGRLFRSLKRWLGQASVERVRVFDRPYRIVALVTPILTHVQEALCAHRKAEGHRVYVGRPVVFEGESRVAAERLRQACGYAGLADVLLYPEPVAAALGYLHAHDARPGDAVLSFDFGGGTLDLCALRVQPRSFEILATHGIPLGGDEIDRRLFSARVFPELGEGCTMSAPSLTGRREVPFPFREFGERLLNWQLAYELNRPELRELLARGARARGTAGVKLRRLHTLVSQNLAYVALRAVERAKVELSERPRTTIEVPEIDLAIPVQRAELERVLEEPLADIRRALEETLERARLEPDQISAVVSTGGSSEIPAVRALLERLFPGRVVPHDTFTSIAAGLALASAGGLPAPTLDLAAAPRR
jgi:hypothetical chaperone protein